MMTPVELANYITNTGTRGVWFWGARNNRGPQKTAEVISDWRDESVKFGPLPSSGDWFINARTMLDAVGGVKRIAGEAYSSGWVFACTGTPPSPLALEITGFAVSDRHEWFDDVADRHENFIAIIDAMEGRNPQEVAEIQSGSFWARQYGYSKQRIEEQLEAASSRFLNVSVDPKSGDLAITKTGGR
jgi:hypothetical protein